MIHSRTYKIKNRNKKQNEYEFEFDDDDTIDTSSLKFFVLLIACFCIIYLMYPKWFMSIVNMFSIDTLFNNSSLSSPKPKSEFNIAQTEHSLLDKLPALLPKINDDINNINTNTEPREKVK